MVVMKEQETALTSSVLKPKYYSWPNQKKRAHQHERFE